MKIGYRILTVAAALALSVSLVTAEAEAPAQAAEADALLADDTTSEDIVKAENFYTSALSEYVNAKAGYSLQYPVAFTDHFVSEDENGFSAKLTDGSAEMKAEILENSEHVDLKTCVNQQAEKEKDATVEFSAFEDKARVTTNLSDGAVRVDIYTVTEQWIYHVSMQWTSGLQEEYSHYADYLMNSFICDELSEG